MSILNGFLKSRHYRQTAEGKKKVSFWTSSQTVEMDDGNNLEEEVEALYEKIGIGAGTKISQEDFDKLTEEQKQTGTYWIYDAPEETTIAEVQSMIGFVDDLDTDAKQVVPAINEINSKIGSGSASDITYDPEGTPLEATNVQDAITEVLDKADGGVMLTKAEYDALSPEEKESDTTYYITDAGGHGGGGTTATVVTQAQYDALSDAEKNNGTVYYISDATDENLMASNIDYSGEAEGTNVAAALNNIQGAVNSLNTSLSNINLLNVKSIKFSRDNDSGLTEIICNLYSNVYVKLTLSETNIAYYASIDGGVNWHTYWIK